jgi:1-acyl-sn-glycerol-3-phosphate acyltransferase
MNERARRAAEDGRQILIFPEGTRRRPGAPPAYKFGVAHLYDSLGAPCVPVALNSGLYWPRRSFIRRPGTAVIEFLDPIPPGQSRDAFFEEIKTRIESASERLRQEAGRSPAGLGVPEGRADQPWPGPSG